MLLFTSVAHFGSLRHDLARMIPPGVPSPMGMVYFTGLCEIAGAVGLLVPRTRRAAAAALIVFFLAILPANIHAARAASHAGLALAPVAVAPSHQGKGVGSALIRRGLEEARGLGHTVVIVVGHPEYYPRFGFAPAQARGIRAPFPVNERSFMALALRPGGLDGIRGVVEYAAPFAERRE